MKTITVVVPTCNRPELLARLLSSLERQTLARGHFDLSIIDDGVLRKGPAAARNAGARKASTPVVAFIDDDAVAHERWLEVIHEGWKSGAFTDAAEGEVIRQGEALPLAHGVHHAGPGGLLTCNLAVRRECFEKLGGFNEAFPYPMNEDYEFFLRLKKNFRLSYLPGMTVFHPVRKLPFWKTFAGAFEHARQRIDSEYLLERFCPDGYRTVKAESTARKTHGRLALGYFVLYAIKDPGALFKHPLRGLLWFLVCAARQWAFAVLFISGRRSWNALS